MPRWLAVDWSEQASEAHKSIRRMRIPESRLLTATSSQPTDEDQFDACHPEAVDLCDVGLSLLREKFAPMSKMAIGAMCQRLVFVRCSHVVPSSQNSPFPDDADLLAALEDFEEESFIEVSVETPDFDSLTDIHHFLLRSETSIFDQDDCFGSDAPFLGYNDDDSTISAGTIVPKEGTLTEMQDTHSPPVPVSVEYSLIEPVLMVRNLVRSITDVIG
jgi:hypothetical protein